MTTYHARVERTISIEFEFDESEIEDDDSPEVAAGEIAQSFMQSEWDEDDEFILVSEYVHV